VKKSDSIEFVLQKIKLSRRGGLPILKKRKLVGMVSERDFVKYFDKVKFGKNVGEIMTKKPFFYIFLYLNFRWLKKYCKHTL